MSIIHDALKKVQQGLAAKTGETQAPPPPASPNAPASIYEDNTKVVDLPQSEQVTPPKNKFKSMLALSVAIVITIGSAVYIYKQCQDRIPKIQKFVRSSYYKLIHKKEPPAFQNKSPQELKPLAKITINPQAAPFSSGTTAGAVKPPAPTTLNIHGIMSNSSGNLVLIDDQVYQEGDEVDGAKIIKIGLDSITINNNGVEQTIPVKG